MGSMERPISRHAHMDVALVPLPARAGVAALLLVLALAAGCGGSAEIPPATDVGLTGGSVTQWRSGIAQRELSVRVRATAPLHIRAVALRPAGFEVLDPTPDDVRLDAGNSVDLKVPYGAARCDADPAVASDALVDVEQDGRVRRVRLPLQDTHGLLTGLHATECTERSLRRQVEFSLTGGWSPTPDGLVLRTTLTLRRLEGRAEVVVTELGGNVLFALRAGPPDGPVAVLAPRAQELTVPFEIETVRCDPHALAESKRSTAFPLFVTVDGSDPVQLIVEPEPFEHDEILNYASDSCAAR
jgi:hypothetical protein